MPSCGRAARTALSRSPAHASRVSTARESVAADEVLAAAVRARQAGAWGRLAGLAVIAHRERLGRRLEDPERRAVWDALWREVHTTADERYHRPTTS